jgi:hypothetical protein
MQIYVDGRKVYQVRANSLDTVVPMTVGTRRVVVQARDSGARRFSQAININVVEGLPAVSVSVSPASATIMTGGTQQFTATVTGSSDTAVTWTATGGTISAAGLYTAPSSAGTFTVRATSVADTSKSASATITVTASSHSVDLAWNASAPAVAGYNIYRAGQSGGPYTRLNSAVQTTTIYTDSSVQSGATYFYVVRAIDSQGKESGNSNEVVALIPSP